MNRRKVVIAAVAGGVAIVLLLLMAWRKREALQRAVPEWLSNGQPPETVTPEMLTVSPAEAFAAVRCRPMIASCGEFTAGRRTRRIYPDTLESDPNSLIRARFELGGSL
jgi:hypothetical protein